ncbi:MAG: helix-hairpin-helix domain-containing protein [Salaquimonas sp.]
MDNIVLIDGIGSKTAKALKAAGVGTLTALLKMDDADLAKICKETGLGSSWKSQEWKVQAQEMVDGKPPRAQVDKDLAFKLAAK